MTVVTFSSFKNFLTSTEKFIFQASRYHSLQSRQKFVTRYGPTDVTSWFPGHMYRGMLQLQAKLAVVDCILEVHDARIPFTGRNLNLYNSLSAIRPRILVLNKCDLADMSHKAEIVRRLQAENVNHVVFTNCRSNKHGIEKIVPLAVKLIKDTDLYNRGNRDNYMMMVIGIPNVGKSSVINRLRNYNLNEKKATTVGAIPGITKNVLEKIRIADNPPIYLLDSPGIIQPDVGSLEVGLKLALCRTLKDSLVGVELMCDYLLYWLNKQKNYSYVEYLNLEEPTDDLRYLLIQVARNLNLVRKVNNAGTMVTVPNIDSCAEIFLSAFRKGKFGKVLLDIDSLSRMQG